MGCFFFVAASPGLSGKHGKKRLLTKPPSFIEALDQQINYNSDNDLNNTHSVSSSEFKKSSGFSSSIEKADNNVSYSMLLLFVAFEIFRYLQKFSSNIGPTFLLIPPAVSCSSTYPSVDSDLSLDLDCNSVSIIIY